ncbi:hypothetical protein [Micromonospora wenchangensis]|uniref:hypothetical protein n=1 Tax=Micromonospora wenchangensis TaxID=1185415 RepID=UPI0034152A0F
MGYPVLFEKTLPVVPRRLLFTARRDRADLPDLPPGAVYVFKVDGRQRLYGDRHLDLADPTVVEAVAVSLVLRRPALITAQFTIPSTSAADDFSVAATFRCQVLAPEAVAESGLSDLAALLTSHLAQDRDLKTLGLSYRIDDINEVRRVVDAQITAYCTLVPPNVRGMSIELNSVVVDPSRDLREQSRRIRDKKWQHDEGRLDMAWQDIEVQRYRDLIAAGPAHVDALGIARNEINVGQLSDRMHDDDRERRQQLGATLQMMVDRGYFDRMPIDPVRLLDEVAGRSMGAAPSRMLAEGTETAGAVGAGPRARPAAERDTESTEPDPIPSEEDIA